MGTDTLNSSCGALIYCISTQRYLFLLRTGGRYPNTWGIVGGKVESGETEIQALNREIQEELGGEIKGAQIHSVNQYNSGNGKFAYHTFLIQVDEEFVPDLNSEHKGYCWVKLDDYPKPLHPGVYKTFKIKETLDKIRETELIK